MVTISLNLVVYNEPAWVINRCIGSVYDIVDEIIMVYHKGYREGGFIAMQSTYPNNYTFIIKDLDDSVVEEHRNELMERSKMDCILILDPDEYLNEGARRYIQLLRSSKPSSQHPFYDKSCAGLVFKRKNNEYDEDGNPVYDNGYPDPQIRFFKKGMAYYPGRVHFPPVIADMKYLIYATGHIIHDKLWEDYENIQRKIELYSKKELEACRK